MAVGIMLVCGVEPQSLSLITMQDLSPLFEFSAPKRSIRGLRLLQYSLPLTVRKMTRFDQVFKVARCLLHFMTRLRLMQRLELYYEYWSGVEP